MLSSLHHSENFSDKQHTDQPKQSLSQQSMSLLGSWNNLPSAVRGTSCAEGLVPSIDLVDSQASGTNDATAADHSSLTSLKEKLRRRASQDSAAAAGAPDSVQIEHPMPSAAHAQRLRSRRPISNVPIHQTGQMQDAPQRSEEESMRPNHLVGRPRPRDQFGQMQDAPERSEEESMRPDHLVGRPRPRNQSGQIQDRPSTPPSPQRSAEDFMRQPWSEQRRQEARPAPEAAPPSEAPPSPQQLVDGMLDQLRNGSTEGLLQTIPGMPGNSPELTAAFEHRLREAGIHVQSTGSGAEGTGELLLVPAGDSTHGLLIRLNPQHGITTETVTLTAMTPDSRYSYERDHSSSAPSTEQILAQIAARLAGQGQTPAPPIVPPPPSSPAPGWQSDGPAPTAPFSFPPGDPTVIV